MEKDNPIVKTFPSCIRELKMKYPNAFEYFIRKSPVSIFLGHHYVKLDVGMGVPLTYDIWDLTEFEKIKFSNE